MEGIRGIQHPLQTPLILDCIFKNLNLNDLQNCREVCRTWRDESRKAMRALAKVAIHCDEPDPMGPLFLELVKSDESTFFEVPFADRFTVVNGVADIQEFWKTCGPHIKYLRLHDVTFSSMDTFRQAIFQLCPNLKELKIVDVRVCGDPAPEPKKWIPPHFIPNMNLKTLSFYNLKDEFSMGWLEILSQFPCLEKLDVSEMRDRSENVFRALEVARQHDTSSWKLKEVVLFGGPLPSLSVPPAFTRLFGNGNFTLTSLSIEDIGGDTEEDVTAVQKILVAHAQSLKKLAISLGSDDLPETDIFPLPGNQVLEHVQELGILGARKWSTRFLQAFPNLQTISLEVPWIPEDIQTPHMTLNACTQLTLYNRIIETDDFKRLFGLLPNLRKLKVEERLDNERFSLICEHWPDLTHLELANSYRLDDAGISGYDQKHVRKINKKGEKGSWRPVTVRRANLSSLKSLRCFSWILGSEEYSKVGYCTMACGILELPDLKHLRVERVDEGVVPMVKPLLEQFPWDDSENIVPNV